MMMMWFCFSFFFQFFVHMKTFTLTDMNAAMHLLFSWIPRLKKYLPQLQNIIGNWTFNENILDRSMKNRIYHFLNFVLSQQQSFYATRFDAIERMERTLQRVQAEYESAIAENEVVQYVIGCRKPLRLMQYVRYMERRKEKKEMRVAKKKRKKMNVSGGGDVNDDSDDNDSDDNDDDDDNDHEDDGDDDDDFLRHNNVHEVFWTRELEKCQLLKLECDILLRNLFSDLQTMREHLSLHFSNSLESDFESLGSTAEVMLLEQLARIMTAGKGNYYSNVMDVRYLDISSVSRYTLYANNLLANRHLHQILQLRSHFERVDLAIYYAQDVSEEQHLLENHLKFVVDAYIVHLLQLYATQVYIEHVLGDRKYLQFQPLIDIVLGYCKVRKYHIRMKCSSAMRGSMVRTFAHQIGDRFQQRLGTFLKVCAKIEREVAVARRVMDDEQVVYEWTQQTMVDYEEELAQLRKEQAERERRRAGVDQSVDVIIRESLRNVVGMITGDGSGNGNVNGSGSGKQTVGREEVNGNRNNSDDNSNNETDALASTLTTVLTDFVGDGEDGDEDEEEEEQISYQQQWAAVMQAIFVGIHGEANERLKQKVKLVGFDEDDEDQITIPVFFIDGARSSYIVPFKLEEKGEER